MRNYPSIGIQIPDLLLPDQQIDLQKWSVIACDQFTSQPNYWEQVKKNVGDEPSTLNLILPEIYLGKPEEKVCLENIHKTIHAYLDEKIFMSQEGMVLIERETTSGMRHGILIALDLEQYDYHPRSKTLIRATEGTILERLPPRIRIRENANLELSHILVLIDDPEFSVIEPLTKQKRHLKKLYDFDLMLESGHLCGYIIDDNNLAEKTIGALEQLGNPAYQRSKYNLDEKNQTFLFAVGDGNHSLATAKAVWDMKKSRLGMDHPLRYTLVELVNIHDKSLIFEPIHRILFGIKEDIVNAMHNHFHDNIQFIKSSNLNEIIKNIESHSPREQKIGFVSSNDSGLIIINNPKSNLAVGTIQEFLDDFLSRGEADRIDYIHGQDALFEIGQKTANCGFYLPAIDKKELFRTVILEGVLPSKTFSMGEAKDKRFYLECRKIQDI